MSSKTEQENSQDLTDIRRSYKRGELMESDCAVDPFVQFGHWMDDALAAGVNLDPTAMVLATVDTNGQPSQRTVLLKGFDEQGFRFFTNLQSVKGRQLAQHSQASLLFPWLALERQVIIYGSCERLSRKEDGEYFHSRPRDSQIAAAVSQQSQPVKSREELDSSFEKAAARYSDGREIELPENWGGFSVRPDRFEFWQGRENRLHDRIEYLSRNSEAKGSSAWQIARLQP